MSNSAPTPEEAQAALAEAGMQAARIRRADHEFRAILLWLVRIRAYSRTGILWYLWAIAGFNIWIAILVGVSIGTGFWASTQPAYHFGITALVGVIPLLAAAYLVGRR